MIPQGSRHPQRHPRQGTAPPGASSGRGTPGEPGKAAKGSILRSQTPPASPAAPPASSPGWSCSLPAVKSRHLPAAPPPPAAAAAPAPGQAPEEVSSKPGRKTCQTKEKRGGEKKKPPPAGRKHSPRLALRGTRGAFSQLGFYFSGKKKQNSPPALQQMVIGVNWRGCCSPGQAGALPENIRSPAASSPPCPLMNGCAGTKAPQSPAGIPFISAAQLRLCHR